MAMAGRSDSPPSRFLVPSDRISVRDAMLALVPSLSLSMASTSSLHITSNFAGSVKLTPVPRAAVAMMATAWPEIAADAMFLDESKACACVNMCTTTQPCHTDGSLYQRTRL